MNVNSLAQSYSLGLFGKALLVFDAQNLNIEQDIKLAATVQNAIQCYHLIYDGAGELLPIHHWIIFFKGINSVQSLSHVRLFVTPWTAACQSFLSITNSRILLKLMSIK